MRKLIFTILILFLGADLFSIYEMPKKGIRIFYPHYGISEKSILIVSCNGTDIDYIDSNSKIFLKSSNSIVDLEIIDSFKTPDSRSLVLTPTKKLKIGEQYFIKIDTLTNFIGWRSWYAMEDLSEGNPAWINKPKIIKREYERTCDGLNSLIVFGFEIPKETDSLGVYIKAEIENFKTDRINKLYFVRNIFSLSDWEKIVICNDPYGGNFKFTKGTNYRIKFMLVDIYGKSDNEWTDWINFNSDFITDEYFNR